MRKINVINTALKKKKIDPFWNYNLKTVRVSNKVENKSLLITGK